MEEKPTTIRIFPGELSPAYYTSVIASRSTSAIEVIRLALERLQIFEDKTLYELYEGQADQSKSEWRKLNNEEFPLVIQDQWARTQPREKEMRLFLRRKEHASLVLTEIVSQFISPEADEGLIEDLCNLDELSEQAMLSNLHARFSNTNIYTYVGSILIAVNPYYFYSIYNPKYTDLYQGKSLGALPPHIFAIADNAYHSMLNNRENQSIIISGESGAGKTESTKFLLHHLMSLSAKLDESQSLELITLGTGPVLEAFGNARTVANNNSSRFGKFILVKFRENGAYHGASIEKYLLEKSRIISQAPEERNYHVFYYLLAGANKELQKQLHLVDIDQYNYLTQSSSLAPPEGAKEYHKLRQSLSMLGFSDDVQVRMFTVLSAILHIGNIVHVKKKDSEETAKIQNVEVIHVISKLLQVDEKTLHLALTTRKSRAGGADYFVHPYRVDEAVAARDSMAKALYGALFDWIVDQVNVSLASSGAKVPHKGHSIGVLDIFGFEVFQKNSFEQFCINYANEQLQQYFNKHIFKLEQAEYLAEGIEWSSVTFIDNQECLDLVAKKPTGLLPLLDEECSFPGASDHSFFQKIERQHKNHPHYHSPQLKLQDPQFTIVHYASEVTYSIQGFREKNRDRMRQDIVDVLRTSHMDLVRGLIGVPPLAVYRWHMAYLKVLAAISFRNAGKNHRERMENRFAASLPFKFRVGSSPALNDIRRRKNSDETDSAVPIVIPVKKSSSPDAFPMEHGGRLRTGLGIRPSRSYDLLTDVSKGENLDSTFDEVDGSTSLSPPKRKDLFTSQSLPSGVSPSLLRKNKHPPVTKSPSDSVTATRSPTLSKRNSPKKSEVKQTSDKRGSPKKSEVKQTSDVKQSSEVTSHKSPTRKESRSRLPSISKMQEKLRKRLSHKSKEAPEARERHRWRSAPRIKPEELTEPSFLSRSTSMRRTGPSKTVSAQFQVSLVSLMERLEKTNPFFVRCIKSNSQKAPCQFDKDLVVRQLRYTGMMETIKIRKAGYSVRVDFEDFYEKYQFLMGPQSSNLGTQIDKFLRGLNFSNEDFQIGHSKVFMREKQKQALQAELGDKVLAKIVIIQKWVRAKMLRCRYLHMRRSVITLQCSVRCWLSKKRVDIIRKRICSAVLIQSAWRSYTARKRLILLKQAAIILQAHWKGKLARKSFAVKLEEWRKLKKEEERKRLEEAARREKEERERLQKEEQRRIAERREKREQELQEALKREEEEKRIMQQKQSSLKIDLPSIKQQDKHAIQIAVRQADVPGELDKRMSILDSEVSEVLFQFDSMLTEIERENLKDLSPSPMPQSPVGKEAPIISQTTSAVSQNEPVADPHDESLTPSESSSCSLNDSGSSAEKSPNGLETTKKSLRNLPKVNEIKQRFILPSKYPQTPLSPTREDIPRTSGNVKSKIAQMLQVSSDIELPVVNLPPEELTPTRRHSKSIQNKIEELTKLGTPKTECVLEQKRSYTPPIVRRKVQSVFFEQARAKSLEPKLNKSQESLVDKPSKETDVVSEDRLVVSAEETAVNSSLGVSIEDGQSSVEVPREDTNSNVEEIAREQTNESQMTELETSSNHQDHSQSNKDVSSTSPADSDGYLVAFDILPQGPRKQSEIGTPKDVELSFKEDKPESPKTEKRFVKTPSQDSFYEDSSSRVDLMIGVKENGLYSPPHVVDTEDHPLKKSSEYDHLTKKSEYDHLSPLEPSTNGMHYHRHRSASDIGAHRVTKLSRQDDRMVGSEVVPREYMSDEQRFSSLQRRKRAAISLAAPSDILKYSPLDESSDLTRGLTSEEIIRLNQRQPIPSPSERLRLFSFSKRKLRLPFSRSRGKKEKDKEKEREKLASPDKDLSTPLTPSRQKRSSPTFKLGTLDRQDGNKSKGSKMTPDVRLPHNFKHTTGTKFGMYSCGVCQKGFTGFMKHALKCIDCDLMVHRHCEDRVPPCKAQIESGSYVTMSRKKIVRKAEDLDDLGQFLLEKIAMLSRNGSPGSLVDRVFKLSLREFHTWLISSYSLSLQSSVESSTDKEKSSDTENVEPKVTITCSQLVNNFSNIFKGIAKREGLNDPCHISIGINQIKTFLDEFGKARRLKKTYSATINPSALRRKNVSGKDLQPKIHKGHKFLPQQFKVATVCEFCIRPIPLLEDGEVCEVCDFTCHEECYKKITKKCEGKGRSKSIPEYQPNPTYESKQFGKPLQDLIPPNTIKIPPLLEKCFSYIESHGLYTQGVYRKSAGVSSKRGVRTALEDDPENANLEGFSVHAVASAVGGFFRELPEPLLTRELYNEFIRAMDLTVKKERLQTLHRLISQLPELNHAVFERLIFHLARVANYSHINKMGPSNLAIIFAPCLLQGKAGRNPEEIFKDLHKQTVCLEAIITEQVEKLNATLRGIRTLTSYARSKVTQLDQFDNPPILDQEDSPNKPPTAAKPTRMKNTGGLLINEDERKRLANELEEIERERVELTVNLPKLEPFILSGDELEQGSGDSDRWSPSPSSSVSPSPSPSSLTMSSASTMSRQLRGFSPISEGSEYGGKMRRYSREPPMTPKSPPTPSITVGMAEESSTLFPDLPTSSALQHLTKNRVSKPPGRRPPSNRLSSQPPKAKSIPSSTSKSSNPYSSTLAALNRQPPKAKSTSKSGNPYSSTLAALSRKDKKKPMSLQKKLAKFDEVDVDQLFVETTV